MQVKRNLALIFISCWWLLPAAYAQPASKQRVVEALKSLADHYRSYKSLSFTISYKYASEERPDVYLDSLKGDFTMSGDKYRYIMDSTELAGDRQLAVMLFREDRIMYLARPSRTAQVANPLALLDSFLLKNDSVDGQLEESAGLQKIIISFRPGLANKRVEYYIDTHSGYLTRMINIVESRQLYDVSARSLVVGNAYAIVETDLTNYREGDLEGSTLDLGRYFKKQGKEYVTVPPYGSYKIFLATPDL